VTNFDPYRGGQKAYAIGLPCPSMKPRGMNEHHWQEWKRGWDDAMQSHADAEIKAQTTPTPGGPDA